MLKIERAARASATQEYGVWRLLARGKWEETTDGIHHPFCVAVREKAVRAGSPTSAIIDSQPVKAA
jgi:hypothetical protein